MTLTNSSIALMDLSGYIDTVLADPDHVMGSAVLVEVIGSVAAQAGRTEFVEWSASILARVHDRSFVVRRIAEWRLFNALADRLVLQQELLDATDWLQRKVAAESNNIGALTLLADRGRTKRVRSVSADRLHRKPGRRATPLGN
jgi:hypothetical protein